MVEKSICKYCGIAYKVKGRDREIFPNCKLKLSLAHKFVEICSEIKRKVYKEKK